VAIREAVLEAASAETMVKADGGEVVENQETDNSDKECGYERLGGSPRWSHVRY
jgi:hypothetical protein